MSGGRALKSHHVFSSSLSYLLAKNLLLQTSHWILIRSSCSVVCARFLPSASFSRISWFFSRERRSKWYCRSSPTDATSSFFSSRFTWVKEGIKFDSLADLWQDKKHKENPKIENHIQQFGLSRTSVCTRSWLERPSLSWRSLRSEFCSFSICPFQSSATGSREEPRPSLCCPASPFPSTGVVRLLRLIAARGTTILMASTSVQDSRLTLPRCRTPRGCGAALGADGLHFGLRVGLGTFTGGGVFGPFGVESVFASTTTGVLLVSIPSPATRIGTVAEPA